MSERPRVLVKEKLADSGVDLLRDHFDVDLGVDWEDGELPERIRIPSNSPMRRSSSSWSQSVPISTSSPASRSS